MAVLRANEVTMKGNPIYLVGPRLQPGDPAPEFTCLKDDLSVARLADTKGKVRLFNVVPSLDTPVCNVQTRTFAKEVAALGDNVVSFTVSLDLPFAMKRYCTDAQINNLINLSDVHNHSFGTNYGVLIEGLPLALLARAVFVVDASDVIRYVEIVPEIANEPNYAATLDALKQAVS
ncbi:thiol peroxidase (atypical 2-Cys peroxiredoxin) [Isosphaera pallida ATCC 43644]|jgi:thiol peroxidase|uniref:Thiol peroxidase (Atypical 2-Cys peroxiredoxin) n=1 Tax=Isosphaera pallida (strain ATCC 43644 / DSM 9630 / IS1B) TaxID=575540 RepID=E8R2L2_ISOPI|nr:thiol peroxidase [Isosphaera pallida]ADV62512.1 thiol peroxidase (atypical 2-Cys peroxiredoxin) [Isosphaera pallida ATCC 43644]